MPYNLVTILGPTASGKTALAARLALNLNGEIISADSRQVYIGMDIGTGKDLQEFSDRNINYHLIDICEPSDEYNLFRFRQDFDEAFNKITGQNKLPVMVGGTGLYLSAVLQNYGLPPITSNANELKRLKELSTGHLREILLRLKPDLHNTTDLIYKDRIIKAILVERSHKEEKNMMNEILSLNIGIKPEREQIKQNITGRLKARLQSGMIEEVRELLNKVSREKLKSFGLEYKYVCLYITGELNYNDMFQKLNSAINNFAKRQLTWFRKMEREGVAIRWFTGNDYDEILNYVKEEFSK